MASTCLIESIAAASPQARGDLARTLLDFLRRGLAIKVDYLRP
ncbi:MAG TPA: hypothetical protein VFH58_08235 [Acidimicrobiales bacterium]|nr:hypothetical protein [Acidimicrobiales bacterium]